LIVPQGMGEVFADPPILALPSRNMRIPGAICLAVLCVNLSLGLWPFHAPRNEVTWLKGSNGLSFGRSGTVIGSDTLNLTESNDEAGCSLEIFAQPHPYQNSATLLAFYSPENPYQLRLSQSLVDFKLQAVIRNEPDHPTQTDFVVPEVFRHATPSFITVTSGREETAVYVAGALAGTAPFRIPEKAFTGRILLGDSPLRPDGWNGQIRGLAIYDSELAARQVFRHYDTWTKNGYPEVAEGERPVALYFFDEHSGRVVHS
jgi:hypothetical protein